MCIVISQCGKMALVSKHSSVVEVFFKIFVVVWIMTRCVLYPFWLVSFFCASIEQHPMFVDLYYLLNTLLLHLFICLLEWMFGCHVVCLLDQHPTINMLLDAALMFVFK